METNRAINSKAMMEKRIEVTSGKIAPKKQTVNWAAVYQYLLDYCNDTTIHGFKYMGETSRPWIERIFWMIAFIISTIGCALLIAEMFEKLQTNPITVSLAERPVEIKKIPFPSVTVCSETQTTFESGFNFRDIVDEGKSFDFASLDGRDKARLQAVAFICKPEFLRNVKFSTETDTLVDVLGDMARVKWFETQSASWNKIYGAPFSLRLTPFGYCFTFNIINATDLMNLNEVSKDFHYKRDIMLYKKEINTFLMRPTKKVNFTSDFPWRATVSDQDSGLNVALRSDAESPNWWCSKYEGFRYFIHGTNELLSSTNRFQLQFGELTELLIKPKMTITEEDLRDYSLERRNCFFEGEKKLRFFKQYTKYNCEQECLSNFTRNSCGCVKFSVIRDPNTKICMASETECYENAENKLFNGDMTIEGTTNYKKKYKALSKCQCLPQCESLKYEIELVKTNYKTHLVDYMTIASLKVFFKDNEFVPLKRFQLYGTVDFLANCGGLLGLFVGVSVLSIVEIFYYFILRLACILRNPPEDDDESEKKENDEEKVRHLPVEQPTIAAIEAPPVDQPPPKYSRGTLERY